MPLGESPVPRLRRLQGFELCDAQCERAFPRVLDTACRAPQILRSLLLPVSWPPPCPSPFVEPMVQRVRPVLILRLLYTCFPSSSSKGACRTFIGGCFLADRVPGASIPGYRASSASLRSLPPHTR